MTKPLFILLSLAIFSGCSSPSKNSDIQPPQIPEGEYRQLIQNHTKSIEKYDGLHNLFNIQATLLNTQVSTAIIDRERYYKQLTADRAQRLRDKTFEDMATETHFFISYYSPLKNLRYLDRGDSLWKVYLDRNGRRFEGRITKYPGVKLNTQALFPHLSRWSKGYLVKFKVPTSAIDGENLKLIFSSASGNAVLEF